MKDLLQNMMAQLSDEDRLIFEKLSDKLNKAEGDISKLTQDDLSLIKQMENKYSDKLSKFEMHTSSESKEIELIESGFGSYVRQVLAKELNRQYPNEEDAVNFAFTNKWIPQSFKEQEFAEKLFQDFEQDICEANQWREEVIGASADKQMAVGMAWFMVIYQLQQRLN